MKTINLFVGPESIYSKRVDAGVMYEHQACEIIFHIDEEYIREDYQYYLEFVMPSGVARTQYLEPNENDEVHYLIPNTVSSQMAVLCYFNIVQIDSETGKTLKLIRPCEVKVEFSSAAGSDEGLCREYDFSVNALLNAIKNGTFKGDTGETGPQGPKGDKGDKGDSSVTVDSELSASSTNPVENRAVTAELNRLDSDKLDSAGGTLGGNLGMGGNSITGLSTPSNAADHYAASKGYVDSGNALNEKLENKVTSLSYSADDVHYPTARAVTQYVADNAAVIDQTLSNSSRNPVQNRTVTSALQSKLSLTGGTMSGNIGMGGNEIHGVKKVIFSENGNGLWLNMSNCPIKNLNVPLEDAQDNSDSLNAVNKRYVNNKFVTLSSVQTELDAADNSHLPSSKAVRDYVDSKLEHYEPVLLLNTTLDQEADSVTAELYDSDAFFAKELTVVLDIPATQTAQRILISALRQNGSYVTLTPQYTELKTVADASKHTLVNMKLSLHSNVWMDIFTGAAQVTNNISWNNEYNRVPVFAKSGSAAAFDARGTGGIKISLANSEKLPAGTSVFIWGEITR